MAQGDATRIFANIGAMNALNNLTNVGRKVGVHQLRLSSGRRINNAADDPAGYTIGKKLEARTKMLSQALNNVGDAKNVLSVAEGGLQNINDILLTMKEKALQAASDTLGSAERNAIESQMDQLASEIDDIVSETTFNGTQLIDGNYNATFQTGASQTDSLSFSLSTNHGATNLQVNDANIDVSSSSSASTAISRIETAITSVSQSLESIGSTVSRLGVKESTLSVGIANTEAAHSRIFDADMAKEQLELSKWQILQQTSTSMLTQANQSSQGVMALFR